MRLLFDHSVPSPLRRLLPRHEITLARERGWDDLANGKLIAAAEAAGFDVLVTCDKNWPYQQNLANWPIAIVVLSTNSWPKLEPHAAMIQQAIDTAGRGVFVELDFPRERLLRRPPPARDR